MVFLKVVRCVRTQLALLGWVLAVNAGVAGCVAQTERVVDTFVPTEPFESVVYQESAQHGDDTLAIEVSEAWGRGQIGTSARLEGPILFAVPSNPMNAVTPVFGLSDEVMIGFLLALPSSADWVDGIACSRLDGGAFEGPPECASLQFFVAFWFQFIDASLYGLTPTFDQLEFVVEPINGTTRSSVSMRLVLDTTGWLDQLDALRLLRVPETPFPDSLIELLSAPAQTEFEITYQVEELDGLPGSGG